MELQKGQAGLQRVVWQSKTRAALFEDIQTKGKQGGRVMDGLVPDEDQCPFVR